MSLTHLLPLTGKTHPLTGLPLRVLGYRADGRPILPMLGGDDTVPERPDDVPQETWDALGDPGKTALTRERSARQEAEQRATAAERERDAARARPGPPKNDPPKPPPPGAGGTGETPDIAALIQQAVDAAIKPLQERETTRDAEFAAERVRAAVLEAAKPVLHDATDALANVDLTTVIDDQGRADTEKIKTALTKVVETKPHLAKSTTRQAPPGIGGGAPVGTEVAEKVKSILSGMQSATGVRLPSNTP